MDAVNVRKDFERAPLIGRTLDAKYVIEEELGVGAMGAVFRARHLALDRRVAVKVMAAELAKDSAFVERFHREARAASRLWHPNCVAVTDFGEAPDGLLYLVMELVPGKTLNHLIEREFPLGERRIANILVQLLSAVAAAHDLGIIHRDLKPENLLVVPTVDDDGEMTDLVKVCDFGLAKMFGANSEAGPSSARSVSVSHLEVANAQASRVTPSDKVTAFGLVLGTPAYMSPEQAMALPIESRSDIYAVGALLYEMLTKRVPFEHESPEEVLRLHAHELPVDPCAVEPSCSPDLAAICLQALEKEPMNRFPTARAMRSAVRRVGKRTSGMTSHFDELRPRGPDMASMMPPSQTPESMPPPPVTPVSLPPPAPSDPIIEPKVKEARAEALEEVSQRAEAAPTTARSRKDSTSTIPSARAEALVKPVLEKAPDRTKLVALIGIVALLIAYYAFTHGGKPAEPAPPPPAPPPVTATATPAAPEPPAPPPAATTPPAATASAAPTAVPPPAPTPVTPPAFRPSPIRTHSRPAPAPAPAAPEPAPTTEPTTPASPDATAIPTQVAPSAAPPPPQDVPAPPTTAAP